MARAHGKRIVVGTAHSIDVDGVEFIPRQTSVVYKFRKFNRPAEMRYPVCIDLPRPRTFATIDDLLKAVDTYITEQEIPQNVK